MPGISVEAKSPSLGTYTNKDYNNNNNNYYYYNNNNNTNDDGDDDNDDGVTCYLFVNLVCLLSNSKLKNCGKVPGVKRVNIIKSQ